MKPKPRNIFFYSDPHFGHRNVIDYCSRPFDTVEQMDEELVTRYNYIVQNDDDLVYWLGDISLGKYAHVQPIFAKLRGKRILVKGNHDHLSDTQYYALGFDAIQLEAKIRFAGTSFRLSHFPYKPLPEDPPADLRYMERRPTDRGDWLLHGHVHCAWKNRRRMINCGVDVWDFYPVRQAQIEAIVKKAENDKHTPPAADTHG